MHLRSGSHIYSPKTAAFLRDGSVAFIHWLPIDPTGNQVIVLKDKNQELGYLELDLVGNLGFLHVVYVYRPFRKMGVATALLTHFLERYGPGRTWKLAVRALDNFGLSNDQLIAFYGRFGFRPSTSPTNLVRLHTDYFAKYI